MADEMIKWVRIAICKEAVNTNLTAGLKGADKNVISAFVYRGFNVWNETLSSFDRMKRSETNHNSTTGMSISE